MADFLDVTVVDGVATDSVASAGSMVFVEVAGPRGPRGFEGEQGVPGERGETGATGATGPAGTIAVGSVSTGSPGSSAVVENVGSDTSAVLNFVVPQGPQGVAGAAGQKGDTGATGAQGLQGVPGERGERGDTGPKGDTGQQGAAGVSLDIQGSVPTYADLPVDAQPGDAWIVLSSGKLYYRDGVGFPPDGQGVPFQGPQGVAGERGERGERGDAGAQGLQGVAGVAGADGRGFTWRGEFSASETYAVDDVISFDGSSYVCLIGGTTQSPVDGPSRWALMALRGAVGATGATGPQGAAGTTSWSGIVDKPTDLVYADAAQTLSNKTIASPALTGTTQVATGGAVELYNVGSSGATNYERCTVGFISNQFKLQTQRGNGTVNIRPIQLYAGGQFTIFGTAQSGGGNANLDFGCGSTNNASILTVTGTNSGTANTQFGVSIAPTINQTSSASYTALLINPTETATGSGTKRLIDAQVGGASRFTVDNAGLVNAVGGVQTTNFFGSNGNKVFSTADAANAVNFFSICNDSGTQPSINANGTSANVDVGLQPKGTGSVYIYASTGNTPTLKALGADSNHNLNLVPKGSGTVQANGVDVVTTTGAQTVQNKTFDTTNTFPSTLAGQGLTSTVTANGTTTLTSASTPIQVLTGTAQQTIVLPSTGIVAGQQFTVVNLSSNSFGSAVQSSNATQITSQTQNVANVYTALVATPTAATDWRFSRIAVDSTLASVTLSNPALALGTNIRAFSGILLSQSPVVSAVNNINIGNAAAGNAPSVGAVGTDTNINLNLVTKGTGTVQANGVPILTRRIQTVTSTVTLGGNANTDYVVFIGASGAVTLPTAVGNTSRYTIKNIDSASKTVSTTSSQTIDGSATATLTPDTSIDLVSDGSNWRVV